MKIKGTYPLILLLMLSACTGLKHVPKGELLYTGSKVQIIADGKIKRKGEIKVDVNGVIRPEPNSNFLGMRPALWLYYHVKKPKKEKGLRSWLKNKVAQEPVYLSSVDLPLISKGIDAKLYNTGFLDSYNEYEIKQAKNGKTASLIFKIHLKQPYTINSLTFPGDTSYLSSLIAQTADKTLIRKGDRYNLETLLKERVRIESYLKERGYYFFNSDYILYEMDTNATTRTVNLHATLKRTMPDKAKLVYRIGQVNVFPDYRFGADSAETKKLVIDSINYYKQSRYIRPRAVLGAVFFRVDSIYDQRVHRVTLSRLNGLGVFKFLNVAISEQDSVKHGKLIVNIFLTPLPKKSLGIEGQLVTKSNNFIGPGIQISFRNRNAFRGAELVIHNVKGSFETQYSGQYKGQFTYEIDPSIELDIPRFIPSFMPRSKVRKKNEFVPRTKFTLDYSFLSRVGYFDMNTVKLGIGYKWKQKLEIDHDLTLLNVNYFNIYRTTDNFNNLLKDNILLRRRFETQFLLGIAYNFTYNEQVKPLKKNQFYFNGNVELSGNMLAALSTLINKRPVSSNNPSEVLGVKFAQFSRFEADLRDYYHLRHEMMLAFRLIAGWGIPYGNSSTLPYIKQFFVGGAYSLRGFPANSVGPGGYAPPDSVKSVFYLQQGGEIKFEVNSEFRFPIYKIFKGAIFLDAGNTWLNKANADAPKGELVWNQALKQLAVSTGAGVRLDVNFFVLRLDVGIPLRSPALPESDRWIVDKLKFKNVVFNLAFGYPF